MLRAHDPPPRPHGDRAARGARGAASGSFTGAAQALGYTQSAISRQIAAVEAVVGEPVFERAARGVRPTEAGAVLVEHAGAVLATLDAAGEKIARIRARLEGRLVLGSIPVAMSVLVPRALARLSHGSPELDIALHEAPTPTLVDRIRHGLLDVAIIAVGADLPDHDISDLRRDLLLTDRLGSPSRPAIGSRGARACPWPTCVTSPGSSAGPRRRTTRSSAHGRP
jgi:DNA-binding transcriptional LysR family regulator